MDDYISKNTYFLLRHGEGEHNVEGFLSDAEHDKVHPSRLTKAGIETVKKTAKELVTDKIDVIYASPMTRAVETASIVNKLLNVEIIKDNRLREIEFGVLSGKDYASNGEYYEGEDKFHSAPEGGESQADVMVRIEEFLKEIHETYTGKNILIIGHGDPLWMMETALEGYELEEAEQVSYIQPGEVHVLGV